MIPNLRKAAFDCERIIIGGGEFGPDDFTLAADLMERATDGREFFVVMLKRADGKVYPDLHKCLPTMYLTFEDAQHALDADPNLKPYHHIVRMVAALCPPTTQGR